MDSEDKQEKYTHKLGSIMVYAMWIMLLALMAFMMQRWWDKQYNPNDEIRVSVRQDKQLEVILERNRFGHYVSSGKINGRKATFFLDTGATSVVVPLNQSKALGLQPEAPHKASTANGVITVYATTIEYMELGPIVLNNVKASINPEMQGDEVLVGMSFLKHLEFTQRGNKLIISVPE